MTRSMFNGQISFGLVNIPVGMHKVTDSHDVSFKTYHAGCDMIAEKGVGQQWYCKDCDMSIEYDDTFKGCKHDDTLVAITRDDLAGIEIETGKTITIEQFVPEDNIDPIAYESPYYLVPTQASRQGYELLRTVLASSGRVGIARYTIRGKTHMAVIRPLTADGDILVLQNLAWPDEVRTPDFSVFEKPITLDPKLVDMAHNLVDAMSGAFDPTAYTDTYTDRLKEVIAAKAAGGEMPHHDIEVIEDISDIAAALKESVTAAAKKRTRKAKKGHAA